MSANNDLPEINLVEEGLVPPSEEAIQGDPIAALNAENQILSSEIVDLKDKLLRALADAENSRRRAERDVADARQYGITNFAREMLSVADNLNRALENSEEITDPQAFTEGVLMTSRELKKTLEKFGVKEINPVGEKFNPNFHQAMFEIPTDEVAAGTVMQVMQNGFVIGERVLRPALVGVAKKA